MKEKLLCPKSGATSLNLAHNTFFHSKYDYCQRNIIDEEELL